MACVNGIDLNVYPVETGVEGAEQKVQSTATVSEMIQSIHQNLTGSGRPSACGRRIRA